MFKKIVLKENQRAFLFRNAKFEEVLVPGVYSFFDPTNEIEVEIHDTNTPTLTSNYTNSLLNNNREEVEKNFHIVEPKEFEIALVSINGKAYFIHPPSSRMLYWKNTLAFECEVFSTVNPVIPSETLNHLRQKGFTHSANIGMYAIHDNHMGLLYVDNKLVEKFKPGIHGVWQTGRNVDFKTVDLRVNELEINGQELLTKDKVTIRLNLVCFYKITDPVKALTEIQSYSSFLYKQIQFYARHSVEARSVDEVLDARSQLDEEILKNISGEVEKYGLMVEQVAIKDIILPGDMRDIFNQVIQAEKLAQANLIKRREETASTRSLLNTARMMEENPILLRLKELEYTENILQKVDNLSIYGGVDDVIGKLFTSKNK